MSLETECFKMTYEIVRDIDNHIAHWVCNGLHEPTNWLGDNLTYGFSDGTKMLGGLIFHDYTAHHSVWWTVYAPDRHWCTRRMLRQMFQTAFVGLDCKRINLLVSASNVVSLKFVQRLGFKTEGLLRKFRDNGEDCYFFGMLKDECPWL